MSAQPSQVLRLQDPIQSYSTDKTTKPSTTSSSQSSPDTFTATPMRHPRRSTWCFSVTDDFLVDYVELANYKRRHSGEPYSFQSACISIMLDRDRKVTKSINDYARIWGWTRQQIRSRWGKIEMEIEDLKTRHGRAKQTNPQATRDQPATNPEQLDSATESGGSNPRPTRDQPDPNPHTITSPSPISHQEKTKRGGAVPKVESLAIPPTLERPEFRALFAEWIDYRVDYGDPPKSWEKLFASQLRVLGKITPAHAVKLIETAIANNWRGLNPDWVKDPATVQGARTGSGGGFC